MKNLTFLLLITGLFFVSCKKTSTDSLTVNDGLIGKWELTEYFLSPGDAGRWYAVDHPSQHTIEFKKDGSFTSSDGAYNNATSYLQTDSTKIKFSTVQLECFYSIEDNNQTLIISPGGCIEGCSNKYRAIRSDPFN